MARRSQHLVPLQNATVTISRCVSYDQQRAIVRITNGFGFAVVYGRHRAGGPDYVHRDLFRRLERAGSFQLKEPCVVCTPDTGLDSFSFAVRGIFLNPSR